MHHLSGLDASFLYLETPEQPMHVGGLNIYELPAGYEGDFLDNVRANVVQKITLVAGRQLINVEAPHMHGLLRRFQIQKRGVEAA